MTALFMAMMLTGAGGMAEAQGSGMPAPVPVPYIVSPPSPPPAPPTQRPRLLQDSFVDYFTPTDYPANALPPGGHAYVAFSVAVGPDGRVTNCTIFRSSGSAALDAATCRVVRERARYRPALDAAGQPAAGRHGGGIMWEAPTPAGAPARISIPAPPPPRVAPPQRARANLSSYFSVDDYPALALRANHQGTTSFRLTIGIDGRVTACEVTSSSNSEPLDQATCRILRSRARYVAARDADGTPTIGHDSGRVTWSLPGDDLPDRAGLAQAYRPARLLSGEVRETSAADYPPGAPPPGENENVSEVRIAIGREGQVIGCDVKTGSGSPALDAAACRLLTERARFEPARDQAGAAICDLAWEFVNWGPAAAARPPAQPGTRQPPTRVPRPLREQLNASLCPGWPVAERKPVGPVPAPPPATTLRPQVPGQPWRARENFQEYFSVDDYPAEALRANAQGATNVLLSIGIDGRVAHCTVAGSSGSPALDAATCRILRARARYLPARDSQGSVIVSGDSARIVWRLPAR